MFKPLLAGTVEDINNLSYPLYASPKLDGIRAVVINGVLLSRNLKPIPNKHVQAMFGKDQLNNLDGELIYGDPTEKDAFRQTTHVVMTEDLDEKTTSKVNYYLFDWFGDPEREFQARFNQMNYLSSSQKNIQPVNQKTIINSQDLLAYEEECLNAGYEGVMIRNMIGKYKFGRSTLREGILLKLKRFKDSEARVLDFDERLHNANEAVRNAVGNLERSSARDGKIGMNTLGSLKVIDIKTNVEFELGSGFDDAQRSEIWNNKEKYLGKLVKYKYFPSGSKDKPRFPTFLGFRDLRDL